MIVLESFAAATPVIASRVAAIPEIAYRQGDAWMFEPDDEADLADRMARFLRRDLRPVVDLRDIANEYSQDKVLANWEEKCLPQSTH